MQWQTEIINGNQVNFFKYDDKPSIEYLATRDENGKFHVNTHDGSYKNIPFAIEFDHYQDMYNFFKQYVHLDVPVVCHIKYNAPNAYVLLTPTGSYYIRVEE